MTDDWYTTLSRRQTIALVVGSMAGVAVLAAMSAAVVLTISGGPLGGVDLLDIAVVSFIDGVFSPFTQILAALAAVASVVFYLVVRPRLEKARTAEWDDSHVRDELRRDDDGDAE